MRPAPVFQVQKHATADRRSPLEQPQSPLYEVDVTRSRHQTFDREAVKGVGGERGSALPGAQWLLQPKWAGTNQILYRAEFLQLVPGFFFTDYAMGSAALQEFMGMATNEQLDAHTFYYLVGLDSVTCLPHARACLCGNWIMQQYWRRSRSPR